MAIQRIFYLRFLPAHPMWVVTRSGCAIYSATGSRYTSKQRFTSPMTQMIQTNPALWLSVGGLTIGAIFGAIVYRFNFCTMGALSDITNLGDWRRFRSARCRRC